MSSSEPPGNAGDDADDARHAREIAVLADRLHAQHPGVSLLELTVLVEQAHVEFASSRVQTYRMILTERAVRRSLAVAGRSDTADPTAIRDGPNGR